MNNKILLKTLEHKKLTRTPVWLMRQAGRYLPEYLKLRKNFNNFMEFCLTPQAASEVTIQPLKRFDLDAAIIFSDILTIPYAMGIRVEFVESIGPVLSELPYLEILNTNDISMLEPVFENIKKVKIILDKDYKDVSLIGFAGAPWTIACYMVEGKSSKNFEKVKGFAYSNPEKFSKLIEKIENITIKYLIEQIKSGVEVIKIFDSWAGILTSEEFKKWVIEPNKRIINAVKKVFPFTPIIGFPRNAGFNYIPYANSTSIDCLALDQHVEIKQIKNLIKGITLQGNLDNVLLASSKKNIKRVVEDILVQARNTPFVFNLGHGVLPHTPIENVEELINTIRNFKQ